jgi:hypothetical protein
MYPLEGAKAACPSYLLMRGGKEETTETPATAGYYGSGSGK